MGGPGAPKVGERVPSCSSVGLRPAVKFASTAPAPLLQLWVPISQDPHRRSMHQLRAKPVPCRASHAARIELQYLECAVTRKDHGSFEQAHKMPVGDQKK